MKSRQILLGSVVFGLAAIAAAGATAGTGKHSAVTNVKAVTKPPAMVVNRYIQDNLRWDKDVYKVPSGGTIHVVNLVADEGPHTFTIVAKKDAPQDGSAGGQLPDLLPARERRTERIRTAMHRRSSRSSRTASASRRPRTWTGLATPESPARARRVSSSTSP